MYGIRVVANLATSHCLCFEPMPDNATRLLKNARLNDAEDRVGVHQVALSDTEGATKLVLREDFEMGAFTGNASIAISEAADGRFHKITVPMRRLDDVVVEEEKKQFQVAKVDIKGTKNSFFAALPSGYSGSGSSASRKLIIGSTRSEEQRRPTFLRPACRRGTESLC